MIDPKFLQIIADQNGIDRFSILREYVQINFLNSLYSQKSSDNLIFKGGTALRFFLPSNRFSEDLDFTTNTEINSIKRITSQVVSDLKTAFPSLKIVDLKTISGLSQKLSLETEIAPQPLTIKLDFSQRELVLQTKTGVIKTDLPVTSTVVVRHLDFPEILSEKWRAIISRQKGRDIYDFWYLLHKQIPLNKDFIQKKLDYYHEIYNPKKLIESINNFDQAKLNDDLRRFLPERDRGIMPILKKQLLESLDNLNLLS